MESLTATSGAGVLLDICGVLMLLSAFACLGSKLFNRYVTYYLVFRTSRAPFSSPILRPVRRRGW